MTHAGDIRGDGSVEWLMCFRPGSGTGELSGLRGEGGFSAPHGPEASVTLDYELA